MQDKQTHSNTHTHTYTHTHTHTARGHVPLTDSLCIHTMEKQMHSNQGLSSILYRHMKELSFVCWQAFGMSVVWVAEFSSSTLPNIAQHCQTTIERSITPTCCCGQGMIGPDIHTVQSYALPVMMQPWSNYHAFRSNSYELIQTFDSRLPSARRVAATIF